MHSTVHRFSYVLSIVLLAPMASGGAPADIPSSKEDFHLFLLMGQSNMSGGVGLAAGDTQPVPHVLKMLYPSLKI